MSGDAVAGSLEAFPGETPPGMKTDAAPGATRALEGKGRTQWMDRTRGYGFLVDVATGGEVYVHYTALKRASRGQRYLLTNEIVEYTAEETPRGLVATSVAGAGGGPLRCEALDGGWSEYGAGGGASSVSTPREPPPRDAKRRRGREGAGRDR
jgi:cold shock CspA family protein